MQKAILNIDENGNNFLLEVPYHMNFIAREAPSRRFDKRRKCWKLQCLRANAQHLKDMETYLEISPEALEMIDAKIKGIRPPQSAFPSWYVHKTEPYGLQVEALNRAWGKHAFAFFMEMGTGKSKVYTDLTTALFLEGKIEAVVILTKHTLRQNILKEFLIHSPISQYVNTCAPEFKTSGQQKVAVQFMEFKPSHVANEEGVIDPELKVISAGLESLSQGKAKGRMYEYLHHFIKSHKCAVIVDESQYIKSHKASRTVNATQLGAMAEFRFIGTGTEILHGPLDLYSQFGFLDDDILGIGDYYSCRNRYAIMGGFEGKKVVAYRNTEELTELVSPWTYQALKKDHLDLPDKIFMEPLQVELSPKQQKAYNEVKKDRITAIQGAGGDIEVVCQNILVAYLALQQICAGYITYTNEDTKERSIEWLVEPDKNPKFKEVLDLVECGRQFNIWSRHTPEVEALTDFLNKNGIKAAAYHGGIPNEERQRIEQAYKDGEYQCFIATPMSAGTGLTFVNAHDAIYVSNNFNLADRLQSEDRNHRIGQKHTVTYNEIVAKGSVELLVLDNLKGKVNMAEFVRESIAKGIKPEELF